MSELSCMLESERNSGHSPAGKLPDKTGKIEITDVSVAENRIECRYNVSGEIKKYFTDVPFYAEYSVPVRETPVSVAVIPLICQMLPIAWIFDAEIIVPEIDEDFFNSMPEFREGFIKMYPRLQFLGKLTAGRVVKNSPVNSTYPSVAFFSGGVDAFQTVIQHLDEKPMLALLWGFDVNPDNTEGWANVERHAQETAKDLGLELLIVKTVFRRILEEGKLTAYVLPKAEDSWWHGFQHGLGLIGHIAPFAYCYGTKAVYISASFTKDFNPCCASDPTIDNFVRYCGCQTVHSGYDCERQEKVRQICAFSNETQTPISLRVCWESSGGSNCCRCEKCTRTIMNILAIKQDPSQFGFVYSDKQFAYMMRKLRRLFAVQKIRDYYYYFNCQRSFWQNYGLCECPKSLRWFRRYDFDRYAKGGRTLGEWLYYIPYEIVRTGYKFVKRVCGVFR